MAFLLLILEMALIKLNKNEKRKIGIFLGSLGLAMLLWVFYSLSNSYVYPALVHVKWTQVPQELKHNFTDPDTLEAQIEGSGWHLIFNQFGTETRELSISLNKLNGKNHLSFKPLLKKLSEQLPQGQQLVAIKPDSIFFNREELVSKRVPVILKYQISFEKFYGLSDSIRLEPAFVSIRGTAASLESIKYVSTTILKKDRLNHNFDGPVFLQNPENATYRIYPELVNVKIPVAAYTEKIMDLELLVKNKTPQQRLSLYPARVKLTISTAISNYSDIGPEDFEAYVDLNNWTEKQFKRLSVKIGRKPDFIKIVKIEPQTVDFIIYP